MVKQSLMLAAIAVVAGLKPAQAQTHFNECVSVTGSSASIIVPTAGSPTINGSPLQSGDEIAVFTQDGLCAGAVVWDGSNVSITAWGDDSVTPQIDGFEPDESFAFRVWDASEDREATDVIVTYSSAQPFYRTVGTYRENAIYALSGLTATINTAAELPEVPTLLFPEDGSIEMPTSVQLEWSAVDGATSYQLQVARDGAFTMVVEDAEDLTDVVFPLSGLEEGAEYFWRVRAVGEAGASAFAASYMFATTDPVVEENEQPSFKTTPPASVFVDQLYSYQVEAEDPDNDVVTLTLVAAPAWLTLQATNATGTLFGTPNSSHIGGHTVVIKATDEHGAEKKQTFSVTVKQVGSVNAPPEVAESVPNQNAILGGAPVELDLAAVFVDADGDPLTFDASTSSTDIAEARVSGTTIEIIPRARGSVTIVIEARDKEGAQASTSFEVVVSGNRAPIARPDAVTLKEDTPTVVNVRKNDTDPDKDHLSLDVIVKPSNGTATVVDEGILYTPALDYFGNDSFVYQVADGYGGTSAAIVYVEVSPVEDAPRFPQADAISTPDNGVEINVYGDSEEDVLIAWQAAIDPEGSAVSHRWELSREDAFEGLLAQVDLASANEMTVSHLELDAILDAAGVALGESITLYHRITATDGKEWSASDSRSVVLTRAGAVSSEIEGPGQFSLHQNYPNPFNPRTTISYSLERAGEVQLTLYNALGRQVSVLESGIRPAGTHSVELDGSDLPSGVYIYRIVSGERVMARTAILLK